MGRANDGIAYGGSHRVPVGQVYPTLATQIFSLVLSLVSMFFHSLAHGLHLSFRFTKFQLRMRRNFVKIFLQDHY